MKAFILKVASHVEFCDVCLFGGFALLGYGLWLYLPWLSYVVCGGVLMSIGLFMGRGSGT